VTTKRTALKTRAAPALKTKKSDSESTKKSRPRGAIPTVRAARAGKR
jgi:hypothetical protein